MFLDITLVLFIATEYMTNMAKDNICVVEKARGGGGDSNLIFSSQKPYCFCFPKKHDVLIKCCMFHCLRR